MYTRARSGVRGVTAAEPPRTPNESPPRNACRTLAAPGFLSSPALSQNPRT